MAPLLFSRTQKAQSNLYWSEEQVVKQMFVVIIVDPGLMIIIYVSGSKLDVTVAHR